MEVYTSKYIATVYKDRLSLPKIIPGEIIRETTNYRVVTDHKPGTTRQRQDERFFIIPRTYRGVKMLLDGALRHNIFNFNLRSVQDVITPGEIDYVPCLRADYSRENLPSLLEGKVGIPQPGEDTIPPPDRMDECIGMEREVYSFSNKSALNPLIPNLYTRALRVLQTAYTDDISSLFVNIDKPINFSKGSKEWWRKVCSDLKYSTYYTYKEFTDPDTRKRIDGFLRRYNDDFFTNAAITEEHITEANKLINIIWVSYGGTTL